MTAPIVGVVKAVVVKVATAKTGAVRTAHVSAASRKDLKLSNDTEKIWDSFSERLSRFIENRVSNRTDAEDLFQEVFLKLHKNIDLLEDSQKLPQWIFAITRNVVTDYYRKKGANREHPIQEESLMSDDFQKGDDYRKLKDCLHSFKETLPETYREVIDMSEFQGIKQKDISSKLGLSLPAVKSRVRRGRKIIKQHFIECCKFEFDEHGYLKKGDLENPQCSNCV